MNNVPESLELKLVLIQSSKREIKCNSIANKGCRIGRLEYPKLLLNEAGK